MSMRFRNSSGMRNGELRSGADASPANLRDLDETRANTGVFDGREQSVGHLRECDQAPAAGAVAGWGNSLAQPVHR
jgi:hypothetical protein